MTIPSQACINLQEGVTTREKSRTSQTIAMETQKR